MTRIHCGRAVVNSACGGDARCTVKMAAGTWLACLTHNGIGLRTPRSHGCSTCKLEALQNLGLTV